MGELRVVGRIHQRPASTSGAPRPCPGPDWPVLGEHPGRQRHRRIGRHRPVRHQERARPGVEERLGQPGQALGPRRAIRCGGVAGREDGPVGIEAQLGDLARRQVAVVLQRPFLRRRQDQARARRPRRPRRPSSRASRRRGSGTSTDPSSSPSSRSPSAAARSNPVRPSTPCRSASVRLPSPAAVASCGSPRHRRFPASAAVDRKRRAPCSRGTPSRYPPWPACRGSHPRLRRPAGRRNRRRAPSLFRPGQTGAGLDRTDGR